MHAKLRVQLMSLIAILAIVALLPGSTAQAAVTESAVPALAVSSGQSWNTFLGGVGNDSTRAAVADNEGNLYVVGDGLNTWGCSTMDCTLVEHGSGYRNAYVAKLDPSGRLLWNTFLGGSGGATGNDIARDQSGNLYISGSAGVWGCTPPIDCTIRDHYGSENDAYVAKLDPSGGLIWNTFLGGAGLDTGFSIALDASGGIYTAGYSSGNWGAPLRSYSGGARDVFVAKLDPSGNLSWNTLLGGNADEWGYGVGVDGNGAVHVAGYTEAAWGCALTDCTVRDFAGNRDGFVAQLDSSGYLMWNTFLGGSGYNEVYGMTLDDSGTTYVAGHSYNSWGTPVRAHAAGADAFVSKVDSSGSLVWNTFLGGDGEDSGDAVAVDAAGNIYVTGESLASWGTPLLAYTADDVFIARLAPSGDLSWNTFLGGTADDSLSDLTLGADDTLYVVGTSGGPWGAPVRGFYYETTSPHDGFVAALAPPSATISGNAGAAGAVLDYLGGSATADETGRYSFNVLPGWSGAVIPSKPGYTFSPDHRDYSIVTTEQAGQDYVAIPNVTYTVSGDAGAAGATVSYTGGSTIADENGLYSFTVPADWSGIATPSKTGYTFTPDHRDYANVMSDQTGQDYQISGHGPWLLWNTFLGDAGIDSAKDVTPDGEGNLYIVGDSQYAWGCAPTDCTIVDFHGVYPNREVYLAKLDSSGRLLWNTFLGGSGSDTAYAMDSDASGNLYVAGTSYSSSWGCAAPIDCTVRDYSGIENDAFIAKVDSSGNLLWNSFLGGVAKTASYGIALDAAGSIYTLGYSSAEWGNPIRGYAGGTRDVFVAKLDPSGELAWNTFLGGSGDDWGWGVGVDRSGNVRVTGYGTAAWGCGLLDCTVRDYAGDYDAFAAKLDSTGHLQWNTFLGSSGYDDSYSLAVDSSGAMYLTGGSDNSWGSPVRPHSGGVDAYVSKIDSAGSLVWNTFSGGSDDDWGGAVAVDGAGNISAIGDSYASWGTPLRAYTAGDDAFISQLDPSGGLIWNTFLGGTVMDESMAISLGTNGTIFATGVSYSTWGSPVRDFYLDTNGPNGFVAALAAPPRISGNAGVGGATLTATGGYETAADVAGNYSLAVPSGWSGALTPAKEGYTFTPDHLDFSNVTADQPGQDFAAELISNYTISGNAGVGGAVVSATGGLAATADGAGSYSLTVPNAWSGTVTVLKAGYTFTPDHRDYSNITADQIGQDYVAALNTYTISGNVGVGGATVEYTGGSTTADDAGLYSFTISYTWSGTVTPSKTGYTFSPEYRAYAPVTADQTSQDYTATLNTYTISGNAGLAGVTISYTGGSATADATGYYSFSVPFDWSGTVTPSMDGYTFSPDHRDYSNVTTDQPAQDYIALVAISGNAGIAAATLSATGGYETTADDAGGYSLAVPYDWSGAVTPSHAGYTFWPDHVDYANVTADQTGQDYTATLNTYTICGNTGAQKVTLTATGDTAVTASSDKDGNYCLTVPYNWSGTVVPSRSGRTFSPASRDYVGVTSDQTAQDYETIPKDAGDTQ